MNSLIFLWQRLAWVLDLNISESEISFNTFLSPNREVGSDETHRELCASDLLDCKHVYATHHLPLSSILENPYKSRVGCTTSHMWRRRNG